MCMNVFIAYVHEYTHAYTYKHTHVYIHTFTILYIHLCTYIFNPCRAYAHAPGLQYLVFVCVCYNSYSLTTELNLEIQTPTRSKQCTPTVSIIILD